MNKRAVAAQLLAYCWPFPGLGS